MKREADKAIHWQHTRCRIGKIKPRDDPNVLYFPPQAPGSWDLIGRLYEDLVDGRIAGMAVVGCYTDRSVFSGYDIGGASIHHLIGSIAILRSRLEKANQGT